jgi:hypothetical protein
MHQGHPGTVIQAAADIEAGSNAPELQLLLDTDCQFR